MEDNLILLGDFNVGRDSFLWNNIIGMEGVWKANSNGVLLLSNCADHNLIISNIYSDRKVCTRRLGCTNVLNIGISWTMLLFVPLTKQDICITRPMRGTRAFPTGHRKVRSLMNVRCAQRYRKHQKPNKKKYNIIPLQDPCTRAKLQESLSSCLVDHPSAETCVGQQWDAFKSATHKACTETIGHNARKPQD